MKKVMLTIRDAERAIHDVAHGGVIATVVPALGADPETIVELEKALRRYIEPNRQGRYFDTWTAGIAESSAADGICMIDLPGRLMAYQWTYPDIGRSGVFECRLAPTKKVHSFPYFLSEQWLVQDTVEGWEAHADRRRRERTQRLLTDARDVLYGEVVTHVVTECLAARDAGTTASSLEIHRAWLMTPRPDLHDQTPRELIMADLQHIDMDIELLAMRMAETGESPPTLERTSHAYRYAGMGNHEWVLYYDLVRFLITECRQHIQDHPDATLESARVRLEQLAQEWLAMPKPDYHNHSPAELIDKERRREPLTLSGAAAVVDHDCPLCQMMAEDMGPCFWHLDGSHMEHEFTFSTCRTRDQWDEQQRQWQEIDQKFSAEAKSLPSENTKFSAILGAGQPAEPSPPIWDRTFADTKPGDPSVPMEVVLFGIGACLAELGMDLKKQTETAPFVADLNRDFGNLRASVRDTHALVAPVVEHFRDTLNRVGELCPPLGDKCTDIEDQLQRLVTRINTVPK